MISTFNEYHLGDQLIHLNWLRKVAIANGERHFSHHCRPEHLEKIRPLVCDVPNISLSGIEATDASFPRESVISLAKQLRGEKGIYLTDLHNRDLIDNWSYAALAKAQPLVIWTGQEFEMIGPEMNQATKTLVTYELQQSQVTTSQVAADLGLSVQIGRAHV